MILRDHAGRTCLLTLIPDRILGLCFLSSWSMAVSASADSRYFFLQTQYPQIQKMGHINDKQIQAHLILYILSRPSNCVLGATQV